MCRRPHDTDGFPVPVYHQCRIRRFLHRCTIPFISFLGGATGFVGMGRLIGGPPLALRLCHYTSPNTIIDRQLDPETWTRSKVWVTKVEIYQGTGNVSGLLYEETTITILREYQRLERSLVCWNASHASHRHLQSFGHYFNCIPMFEKQKG